MEKTGPQKDTIEGANNEKLEQNMHLYNQGKMLSKFIFPSNQNVELMKGNP